ncbi:hypothetical protein GOBAR_DD03798 [Gossypium barbadense]|nr:hypothetical protein GOBAR_DD03798 [Gossypium barbadense]
MIQVDENCNPNITNNIKGNTKDLPIMLHLEDFGPPFPPNPRVVRRGITHNKSSSNALKILPMKEVSLLLKEAIELIVNGLFDERKGLDIAVVDAEVESLDEEDDAIGQ